MRAGLQGLGLTPEAFWRLTPVELRMMLGADALAPPLTRARLEELAAAFPDARKGARTMAEIDELGRTRSRRWRRTLGGAAAMVGGV